MSSKPFRRKDLKHDEFITVTGRATHWLMERRRRIGWVLLAVALAVSVIFSLRFAHQRQEQNAAALLAAAMEVYRAPVIPPTPELPSPTVETVANPGSEPDAGAPTTADPTQDPAATGGDAGVEGGAGGDEGAGEDATPADAAETPDDAAGDTAADPTTTTEPATPAPVVAEPGLRFADANEKYRAALERFVPIVERYGNRPSGRVAAYYLGICYQELGDSSAAIEALTRASEASGSLISSMALYRLGQLELGAGNAEAAVGYFERLEEGDGGVFPREEALMAKARAQREAGDPRGALATYQRVLQDFAGSYSEVEARSFVEEISAELGVDPNIQG